MSSSSNAARLVARRMIPRRWCIGCPHRRIATQSSSRLAPPAMVQATNVGVNAPPPLVVKKKKTASASTSAVAVTKESTSFSSVMDAFYYSSSSPPRTIVRTLSSTTQQLVLDEDEDNPAASPLARFARDHDLKDDNDDYNNQETTTSSTTPNTKIITVDMLKLQEIASQKTTPLRLADMFKYAACQDENDLEQRIRNAQFLHKELPIRMAQRAMDLLTLPRGLHESTAIHRVAQVYLRYLRALQQIPLPTDRDSEQKFTALLESILLDRTSIPTILYQGIAQWRANDNRHDDANSPQLKQQQPEEEGSSSAQQQQEQLVDKDREAWTELEDALYCFFTARVGLRFLTEHHIMSSPYRSDTNQQQKQQQQQQQDYVGCIQADCDPLLQVQQAAKQVEQETMEKYGVSPEIVVLDSTRPNHQDQAFTYVPHHLQYMVTELLKNSCSATVKHYQHHPTSSGEKKEMPPIKVVVVKGAEDVSIKIADQGGGAPRSIMEQIWSFAHTSSSTTPDAAAVDESSARGFGLPLARIYARYFGGELTLRSMEGYGVDAYLYLPRLGQACENLPASVVASPGEQDSSAQQHLQEQQQEKKNAVNGAGNNNATRILNGAKQEKFW